MTISLHRRFVDQVAHQTPAIRAAVFEAMLALPDALRDAAKHTGLGPRNASGTR